MRFVRFLGVACFLAIAIAVGVGVDAQTSIPGSWGQLVPGGRLALASPTAGAVVVPPAVAIANVTASQYLYYVPYQNNLIPVYINGVFVETPFATTGLPLVLSTTNNATTSTFDVFATYQNGAVTLCTGPAWTNGTTRAQAISQSATWGVYTNTLAMSGTCFAGAAAGTAYTVPALTGTYLGSVYTTGSGVTTFNPSQAAAAHGSNNTLGVFNAYNRVHMTAIETTSTTSNTYATATWQPYDGGSSNLLNRITVLDGLGVISARGRLQSNVTPTASDVCALGIDLNSITAAPVPFGSNGIAYTTAFNTFVNADYAQALPVLGLNYYQAMEDSVSAATCTETTVAAYYALTLDLDD
jgi:hypothetical protein